MVGNFSKKANSVRTIPTYGKYFNYKIKSYLNFTCWKIRSRHPHVIPHVVVPDGVSALRVVGVEVQLIHSLSVVLVDSQGRVGVMSRHQVRDNSGWNAESTAYCRRFFS